MFEDETLHRQLRTGDRIRRKVAVEDPAQLDRCVGSDADVRRSEKRIEGLRGLDGHEALPEVVGELDDVGAALRVELAKDLENAGAVRVHEVGPDCGLVCRRLLDEAPTDACRRKPWVAGRAESVETRTQPGRGHNRDLGDVGKGGGQRRDLAPDAAAAKRMHFASDEGDPHRRRSYTWYFGAFAWRSRPRTLGMREQIVASD